MNGIRRALPTLVLLLFPVFVVLLLAGAVAATVVITSSLGSGGPLIAKLLVFPVIAAIWYGVKDVRSLQVPPTDGIELSRAEHAKLWSEVTSLAQAAQTPPPERIVVVPEVNAAVTEAGGVRELIIGLPLLGGMRVGELRSVIGHELGHFAGGDTAEGARTMRRVYALHALGVRAGFLTRWFLGSYAKLYAYAAGPVSREMERAADRIAIRVAGAKVAADAMRTLARLNGAWAVLSSHYIGLFTVAGRRAPMIEGLRHVMESNSEELDAFADAALTQERATGAMTHPSLAERIGIFEAAHAGGEGAPPLPGGEAPATDLIGGGLDWLGQQEQRLFREQLPLTTWEEVVTRAGRESIGADAVRCSNALVAAGAGTGTLGDAIALLEPTDAQPGGRLGQLLADGDDEEAAHTARYVLWTLATNALLVSGKGRFAARWDSVPQLVTPEGETIDVDAPIDAALASPDGGPLRSWLTDQGIDLAAPVSAEELRPQWLAAMSSATGSWAGRADVHIWSTGLLLLPIPPDVVKADKDRRSNDAQHDRLAHAAGAGLEAGQQTVGATWIAQREITSVELKSQLLLAVTLGITNSEPTRFKATRETAMIPTVEDVGWAINQLAPTPAGPA